MTHLSSDCNLQQGGIRNQLVIIIETNIVRSFTCQFKTIHIPEVPSLFKQASLYLRQKKRLNSKQDSIKKFNFIFLCI